MFLPPISGLGAQPRDVSMPITHKALPRTVPLSALAAPWAGPRRQKPPSLLGALSASQSVPSLREPSAEPIAHAREEDISLVCRGIRNGQVLRKQTILKADHFPSCYNTKLPERIDGAPNFRQVSTMPIYGLGAPTARGMRSVCARVAKHGETIVWCNLREEPVVYLHGRPFCVKDRAKPFNNLENGGIARTSVEQAEALLKAELLVEAALFGGRLLVTDETKPLDNAVAAWGESYCYWESAISEHTVCTSRELYQQLQADGVYNVRYHRIPITDESPPLEADFDAIINAVGERVQGMAFVFNCQLGRGRTTTGMTIACTLWRSIAGDGFDPSEWDVSSIKMLPEHSPAEADAPEPPPPPRRDLTAGEYESVVTLVSRIPSGSRRKQFVDCAINKCSHMQNLREDILLKKNRAETLSSALKRDHELHIGLKYLERYLYLILFNQYVCSFFDSHSSLFHHNRRKRPSFKEWVVQQNDHFGLYPILDRLALN